jgi:methionyl-tRNA synthetase
MTNKIYISTTLPYANSKPHVGHALEFVQADFLSRYYRSQDKEVIFNIGLDEHGVKIFDKAYQLGISPKQHVDNQFEYWKEFCELFNISYDNFYRTSDTKHKEIVQTVWNRLVDKGLIEKKQYTAKYCKGCEEFKNEKDLVFGKCETHINVQLEEVNEENYFLKDSSGSYYKLPIDFLKPIEKSAELKNFYNDEQDLSISRLREKSPWGIPVPNDEEQTIYVWFEALLNYVNACGEEYWNEAETIILCGPDNLRFQGKLLRQIYEAADFQYLNRLYVHGSVLDENGKKMSKSLGNVIDPVEQVESNNELAVRYYILNGIHTTGNSAWKKEEVSKLYNAHIVNDYGNLISRTLHLIDKFDTELDDSKVDDSVRYNVERYTEEFHECVNDFEINRGLNKLSRIVKFGNEYINDKEPWKEDDSTVTLNSLYYLLDKVTECYKPVIPNHYEKIKEALKSKKKQIIFEKL